MNDNNQFVHNQEAFKLYKAKGYTKPYHENEYGWFDLSVEDIKKETIYEKGSDEITISIVHPLLPAFMIKNFLQDMMQSNMK